LARENSGTSYDLHGIAFGNGTFVAVGGVYGLGTILTSTDGVSWVNRGNYGLSGVAYGNGKFVAVGYVGTFVTSTDGVQLELRVVWKPNSRQCGLREQYIRCSWRQGEYSDRTGWNFLV